MAASAAHAQLAVSAEDGKQLKAGEAASVRTIDRISIYRISAKAIAPISSLAIPTSMIGPPRSVAFVPGRALVLVTAAQRLDPSSKSGLAPGSTVSVVDLGSPRTPRLVQTLSAGLGASGVAVDRSGTIALVANAGDDTVSAFTIARGRLAAASIVALPKGSKPVAIEFAGNSALVVAQTSGKLFRLAVRNASIASSGIEIATPASPYSIAVSRSGAHAYVTTLGGGAAPRGGTIAVVDLLTNQLVQTVEAGVTPEHVAVSPSGRYVQVTLINGSNADPSAANFQDHGFLKVYRVGGDGRLTEVAATRTGRWCQGAAWSSDERTLLLQCAEARQIEVYRFDGRSLARDRAATIQTASRPGAIAVAQR